MDHMLKSVDKKIRIFLCTTRLKKNGMHMKNP
ncbi:UNVERIFIED_ORG: hypothetical protein DFS12_101793 [Chitinophaga ginsengisegetis]|nr:hypothetical protein [Chitinophaga ginsengisegetis]MDR6645551.1 hypothetical protein [Chitinophaga ginsengisegetis]MDR6651857.1 hypothetical protein [Chitinophaga ginsengisegetis]